MGEMMRGHLGALFVHGMYLKQHWIPGSLTYYYGIMQVRERSLVKFFFCFLFFFYFCLVRIGSCNMFVWNSMTNHFPVYTLSNCVTNVTSVTSVK